MFMHLFLFTLFLALGKGTIDFEDCGSFYFDVDNVEMEGCEFSPCEFRIGKKIAVTLHLENQEMLTTRNLQSKALIFMRGYSFPLSLTPDDPCPLWHCPLTSSEKRTFSGILHLDDIFMLGRARLNLVLNYLDDYGVSRTTVCVDIAVDIEARETEENEPTV